MQNQEPMWIDPAKQLTMAKALIALPFAVGMAVLIVGGIFLGIAFLKMALATFFLLLMMFVAPMIANL